MIAALFYTLLQILEILLFIRIILSWVAPNLDHPVARAVYQMVDPILHQLQKIIPPTRMGIDFSPILLFILIDLVKRALLSAS